MDQNEDFVTFIKMIRIQIFSYQMNLIKEVVTIQIIFLIIYPKIYTQMSLI